MENYYVNEDPLPNGYHEVHKSSCSWLMKVINRKYLGKFSGCKTALAEAKKLYRKSNGCFYCNYKCHTG